MVVTFYVAGAIAILATARMLSCVDVVHGLLYLVVSLLAAAVVFLTLGAPFVFALEIIVYAGAIVVLFVFVVMMLQLGEPARRAERLLLTARGWIGPAVLSAVLLALLAWALPVHPPGAPPASSGPQAVGAEAVGAALFGPYLVGVELASLLLLSALVGVFHLGVRQRAGARPAGGEA